MRTNGCTRVLLFLLGVMFLGLQSSSLRAQTTYQWVIGTGDTVYDPNYPSPSDLTVSFCDAGSIVNTYLYTGLENFVCAYSAPSPYMSGNAITDGGVYYPPGGSPFRSFRREDDLPSQTVSFEKATVPMGYPATQPGSTSAEPGGDTYVNIYFCTGILDPCVAPQQGVYRYSLAGGTLSVISDTTQTGTVPGHSSATWTSFSTDVAASPAGAFFEGTYKISSTQYQAIYQYTPSGGLQQIVAAGAYVPGTSTPFTGYGEVAANSTTVLFEGNFSGGFGVYAYDLSGGSITTVIDNTATAPHGSFTGFAPDPNFPVHGNSLVLNDSGGIALVANYKLGTTTYAGVFTNQSGPFQPIISTDSYPSGLLSGTIGNFHTLAINSRGELAFIVATDNSVVPTYQGLVFYGGTTAESVFQDGACPTFSPSHSLPSSTINSCGGVVSGSQALDSASPPDLFFRLNFYTTTTGRGTTPLGNALVLATLN